MMTVDGISSTVSIIRSSRKTIGIQLKDDGVLVVRAPKRLSDAYLCNYLLDNAVRIERYVRKISEKNKEYEKISRYSADEMKLLKEKAKAIIPERVKYYAGLLGVTYGKITIRCQKTRWGSCSAEGNLSFNCMLMDTPPEVIDSVVVHELCHRLHMNHSKSFYASVYSIFPEYEKWNKWLKNNGQLIIRKMLT